MSDVTIFGILDSPEGLQLPEEYMDGKLRLIAVRSTTAAIHPYPQPLGGQVAEVGHKGPYIPNIRNLCSDH